MPHTAILDPRPTVLVFEDEALVAMLVEDLLADAGYRAVWALEGRGDPSEQEPPEVFVARAAVVGLRLARGLDGRDVLRRLRERHPEMPVLVVTGYDPFAPEADLRGLGGPTVRLRKPFGSGEFLEQLAGVLAAPARPLMRGRRASDAPAVAAA